MGELLGITGSIGSGKSTFAKLLGVHAGDHAIYEFSQPIIEVANRFNQLLEAELNFETTHDDTELINQLLIWMPDVIAEHLHFDTTWSRLAVIAKDQRLHPELYQKLFWYLHHVRHHPAVAEQTITSANKNIYRPLLQWLGGYFVSKLSQTIWVDELFRRINLHDAQRSLVVITGLRYPSDAEAIRQQGGRVIRLHRGGATTDKTDVTESQRHHITANISVHNNGSLEQLEQIAEKVWNDIAAGEPQRQYTAA